MSRGDAPNLGAAAGFSLMELLIAAAIGAAVAAAILALAGPARGIFQAQPEISEMNQRLRAALHELTADLTTAGAGLDRSAAAVLPYRVGAVGSDPDAGVFYRPDAITVVYVPWERGDAVSRTYHLRPDAATNAFQLMRYDGGAGDFPAADHIVSLAFEYLDADGAPIDPLVMQDGPWLPDPAAPSRFDEDLLRIRRVSVRLRVQAALASMRGARGSLFASGGTSISMERYAPDTEIRVAVTLRNVDPAGD